MKIKQDSKSSVLNTESMLIKCKVASWTHKDAHTQVLRTYEWVTFHGNKGHADVIG